MKVKQLSVFLENKAGTMAELSHLLADKGINLRALCIADTQDFGIVRLITTEPELTLMHLREAGYICTITEVLAVAVDDTAGGMNGILVALADANLSIEYTYASLSPKAGKAFLIVRVKDNEAAEAALTAAGLVSADELF